MEDLPRDVLFSIALQSPPGALFNLCQTDRRYADICREQHFWKEKLYRDFPGVALYGLNTKDYKYTYSLLYQGIPLAIKLHLIENYPYYVIFGDEMRVYSINGYRIDQNTTNPLALETKKVLMKNPDYLTRPSIWNIVELPEEKLTSKPYFVLLQNGYAILTSEGNRATAIRYSGNNSPIVAYYPMWLPDPEAPLSYWEHEFNDLPEFSPTILRVLEELRVSGDPLVLHTH